MKHRNTLILLYSILFAFTLALLILFFFKTWGPEFSSDLEDWALFGNFLSPLVSLFTLGAIIYTLQKDDDREEKRNIRMYLDRISELSIELGKTLGYFFEEYKEFQHLSFQLEAKKGFYSATPDNEHLRDSIIELNTQYQNFMQDFKKTEEKLLTQYNRIESVIYLNFQNKTGAKVLSCSSYIKDLFRYRESIYNSKENFFEITVQLNTVILSCLKELKRKIYYVELPDSKMNAIISVQYKKYDKRFGLNITESIKEDQQKDQVIP